MALPIYFRSPLSALMSPVTDDSPDCGKPRKIVVLTSHVFLPSFRKASVHFVSRNWAELGHDVTFVTVGHSWLSLFKQPKRLKALGIGQRNRFSTIEPGLRAGAYIPFLHAFSTRNALANRLIKPIFRLYGAHLPRFVREAIAEADVLVFESGTAITFFGLAHRLNKTAKTIYFCRDLLSSIGTAPILQETEQRLIGMFDSVCVPSRRLGQLLPPGGNVNVIAQGVETKLFDNATQSPYAPGTRNAVAVGDMLFDQPSVAAMAAAAPDVTFHLFGIYWQGEVPPNIRIYGERAFETIVAYIRHADFGLAPYRLSENEVYLAESSLKLLQYAYCRLPVMLPNLIPATRGNEVIYSLNEPNDWAAKIAEALSMPRSESFAKSIMTWKGIAAATLATVEPRG